MEPIKIAILGTQGIPANYGGFETFAEELATRWSEDEAFEITVVCPGPRKSDHPTKLGQVRLMYVPSPSLGPLTTVAFDVRSLWQCRHFDIVYMLGYGAAFACGVPRAYGAKVWINMDGLEWRRSKWSRLARAYLRFMEWISTKTATRLIADAEAIRAYYLKAYGSNLNCSFIPYGANLMRSGEFSATLLPESVVPGQYFLVVARLEPENQILEIIQGYLKSKVSVPLIVVGGIQNPNSYVQHLLSHCNDRIRFIGGVYDKPRLAALRCHARAYFHGHTVGGTNPSLLEAIAAGQPIIAHDNPFNREVTGDMAIYFDGPEAIKKILKEERYHSLSSETWRASCQTLLQSRYVWEKITETYKILAKQELGR